MELNIYNGEGILKFTAPTSSSCTWTHELMSENSLSVSFISPELLTFLVNDYIEVADIRFTIRSEYRPQQNSTLEYSYNMHFYGPEHDAERVKMLNLTDGQFESQFSLDNNAAAHLQKVVDNLNRIDGSDTWKVGEVVDNGKRNIEYSNVNCWDALGMIAETFETEWWIDGHHVNLTRCEREDAVSLGYGQGLTKIALTENSSDVKFFTRLIPLGSARNIDRSKYGFSRLQLPGRQKYVEQNIQYGLYEQVEEAAFSEIYPKRVGKVSDVRHIEKKNEKPYTIYYFKDKELNFNPNDYELPGLVKHISFLSGELNGRDFEVNYNSNTREFEIITTFPDERTQIPGGHIIPASGEEYILWNISMPDEYYTQAEKEYEAAVRDYLQKGSVDTIVYRCDMDYIYVDANRVPLIPGQRVRLLSNEYFGETGYKDTRITRISRKLDNLSGATIECTNKVGKGWKKSIDTGLNDLKYVVAENFKQAIIEVLKTWDTKTPTNYDVFSSLRSRKEIDERAISKLRPDESNYFLKFLGGLLIEQGLSVTGGLTTDTLTATEVTTQIMHILDKLVGKEASFSGTVSSYDYAEKFLGWLISPSGDAEFGNVRVRGFLESDELRYNRVEVVSGERWNASGGGIIASVDEETCRIRLKLEPGEVASVAVDDICKATFNDAIGFQTVYFRVTEIVDEATFAYVLRDGTTHHPCALMHFVCYGNFTNVSRQCSSYETQSYKRYLSGVSNWEITKDCIVMQLGDLSNLKLFGINMEGHSAYLRNVYLTGTIRQLSSDGVTETPVPCFKGEYVLGNSYYYYDEVVYNGSTWLCISENSTEQEPTEDAADWKLLVRKGIDGKDGSLLRPRGIWQTGVDYVNDSMYRDTVIYNGNSYVCKVSHTSDTVFDSAQWSNFNEFVNVATQVMLAENASIDVLGASSIFVGDQNRTQGWEMTGGAIKHNVSGLELTVDGRLVDPDGLEFSVGGIENVVQDTVRGGDNLVPNSDYAGQKEVHPGWDESLNGTVSAIGWSDYDASIANPEEGYHAHLNTTRFDFPVFELRTRYQKPVSVEYVNMDSYGLWTIDGVYRKSPVITHNQVTREKILFYTNVANAVVRFEIKANSESNYDWLFVGKVDDANASYSNYQDRVSGTGTNTKTVSITVPAAGQHFVIVGYRKDSSNNTGSDCGWYRLLSGYVQEIYSDHSVHTSVNIPRYVTEIGMDGEYQLGFEVYADTANLTVSYEFEANGGQKTFLAKELNSWQTISQIFKVRNISSVPTFKVTALGGIGGTGYIRNVSIRKLGAFAKELLKTGIDISNRKIVLTADKTLVRSNSGVEIAMFKEVNGVPMIDAKNLYTENLTVSDGATIGSWKIYNNRIMANYSTGIGDPTIAGLNLECNGGKFLRINEQGEGMMNIRNDQGDALSLSTYGGGTALAITANGANTTGYAIKSAGQHMFYQRSGDVWNAPGVLWAGRISSGGDVQANWGNGCTINRVRRSSTGVYIVDHNLNDTDYMVFTTCISNHSFVFVPEIYNNYFVIYVRNRGGDNADQTFNVMIVGRNKF